MSRRPAVDRFKPITFTLGRQLLGRSTRRVSREFNQVAHVAGGHSIMKLLKRTGRPSYVELT